MTDNRAHRTRATFPGGRLCALLASVVLCSAVVLAGCSDDRSAATTTTTTTERSTTTAPPATTAPAAEQAPQPAWVVQLGSPKDDSLEAVAGRRDAVVATGWAEGAVTAPAGAKANGGARGGRDALVVVVGSDGKVRTTDQAGAERNESAAGVGSASDTTITCGSTDGAPSGAPGGSDDAWCAPVDPQGVLGPVHQQGGTDADHLRSVAVASDGGVGYAAGDTLGLFPGATDTTAGVLGGGDVLLWQVAPDGAPRWVRQFGTAGADVGRGVSTTADGDALVVGSTQGDIGGPSRGDLDGFIARFDPTGLPRWIRQFGTDRADSARAVATGGEASRGNETFVAVGTTDGALAPAVGGKVTAADAPKLDGTKPAPSNAGGTDALAVAFDSSGNQKWAAQLGTPGTDEAAGVAIDGRNVLVAGTTTAAIDTAGRPAAGGRDGFLAAVDAASGAVRWITQFGSAGDEDVTGISITEDGVAVVSGRTTAKMGDTPNAGGTDGFLIAFPLPSAGGRVSSSL